MICDTARLRNHLWSDGITYHGASLVVAADILIASSLALAGIGMTPLPVGVIAATLGAAAIFMLALDWVKAPLFFYLQLV